MITIDPQEIQIKGFRLNPRVFNAVVHLLVLPLVSNIMQIWDPSNSQALSLEGLNQIKFKH